MASAWRKRQILPGIEAGPCPRAIEILHVDGWQKTKKRAGLIEVGAVDSARSVPSKQRNHHLQPPTGQLLAVFLNPGCTQTGQTMFVDRALPAQKLVDCQSITIASLFEAQEATANSSDDFGFAPDHPTFGR